jgi:hypothetical protein
LNNRVFEGFNAVSSARWVGALIFLRLSGFGHVRDPYKTA